MQQTDAAVLLEKAVAEEPANYDLRMGYAHALRDRKQFPAAAEQFQAAAKLKPGEAKTWNELGGMLYMTGDHEAGLSKPTVCPSLVTIRRGTGFSPQSCWMRSTAPIRP